MIFSEEMYNAMELGYKFEVLHGYTFNKANVFEDYINQLYQFRIDFPKTDPMNYTAKIIMNSLYGRFGMNDDFTLVDIIHKDEYQEWSKLGESNLLNYIDIGEHYIITSKNNI